MSEYLSKEEIKQWRSSLEKITLEEFAKRLGKTLKEEKQTRDIVDIVLKNEKTAAVVSEIKDNNKKEQILKIAQKSQEIQKEVMDKNNEPKDLFASLNLTFKKTLTQREKTVLEYFLKKNNEIVYAKELAQVLDLPTDYVYKYIKNLRAKIDGENLKNAEAGGFMLTV